MLAQDMRKLLNILNKGLTEAPISDIQLHGDFSQPGSFRNEDDRKLISSPKARDKIIRMFEKTPFDFVVHVVNLPHANQEMDPYIRGGYGSVSNKDLRNRFGIDLPPPRSKQIRIIYRANEGFDRVPLTGWIMAHRFCHSLENGSPGYAALLSDVRAAIARFERGVDTQHADYRTKREAIRSNFAYDAPDYAQHTNTVVSLLGSMASGRQGRISSPAEFTHECCSQWLLRGAVRLNRVPGIPEEDIAALEDLFNQQVPPILKDCQGRTFFI